MPESMVKIEGGVVILTLREYRRLIENSVPAIYLKGRKARALDRLVEGGIRDYRKGKTRKIHSLADLDR